MISPFHGIIDTLFSRKSQHKQSRWTFLGADGRVLDIGENAANHIGQSVNLPAPTSGNRNTVSILDARSENPSNPEDITINLNVIVPNGVPGDSQIIPQAQIVWGSGGALNTAIVDIVTGTSITVSASLIRVDGIYFAPTAGASLVQGIQVSANLAYGTRGSGAVAPSFTDFGSAAATASFVSKVPAFARDVTVEAIALDAGAAATQLADLSIFMTSSDTGAAATFFTRIDQNCATAPNTVFPITYPLPGWVRSLSIKNNSLRSAFISARYGLAL